MSDSHYAEVRDPLADPEYSERGCALVGEAIGHAGRFDAIAFLGDLLADGTSEGSPGRLAEIRDGIRAAAGDVPLLVVPGNHDGPREQVFEAFGTPPGLHETGEYRFVTFVDPYAPGDFCTRTDEDFEFLAGVAERPGGPIIVLQHNPINPQVVYPEEPDYPFMHTNREQIMDSYSDAGALLSLSGHYHRGQPLNRAGGVWYYTVAALVEPPFNYAIVTLRGAGVSVEPGQILSTG